jgi:acyl-CoA oxidase
MATYNRTEIGHGSNVQAIETRADYDSSTEEFVLTSPTATSTKFMIGNVGVHGSVIVLMAQLWIGEEKKGVHGFVVRIREEDGSPHCLDGVDVGDVGLKSSWNEVDNAWIRFKGMRIPRENLLNAFADVNKDGSYVSKVSSPSKLFAATLSQLLIGRINYVGAPLIGMQIALNTAIRYANARRQFATNSADQNPHLETQIMQYTTHYTTLMHFLAKTVALQFSRNAVIGRLSTAKSSPESLAEYHALLSGLKAYVCEWSYVSLGHLRVMTGGTGIILSNGIGHLHNFFDVFQTAEGDRTVLYQQLGRYLVTRATKNFQGISGMLHFASQVFSQLLVQYNPILSMVEDNEEENLCSPGFLLKALELRHLTTIRDLLSKMQTLATAAIPRAPSQIWNDCLLDIISVSDAYLELFVFQQCHDQLTLLKSKRASASTPAEQSTIDTVYACMKNVAAVCGLGFLKEDFQFFMRSGLFSAKRCHFIENAWVKACQQLRDHHCEMLLTSSEMVECFYDAPIGQKDGDYPTHVLRAMKPSQAKL